MLEQPDPQDIRKSREGDATAFREIVRTTQSYVFALTFRLLRDEEDAKDAVQEVYVRVWKNIGSYDERRVFTTWLYRIATNHCLDRLRHRRLQNSVFDRAGGEDAASVADAGEPGALTANRDLAEKISSLVSGLSPKQELVFILRDLQDLSVEEVCAVTGMSRGSVRVHLHHARKTIREKMASLYGERG